MYTHVLLSYTWWVLPISGLEKKNAIKIVTRIKLEKECDIFFDIIILEKIMLLHTG